MSFWPDDIDIGIDEVLSPRDIMEDAGKELEGRINMLAVSIPESRLDDRIVLTFEIMHRKSHVTLNLFEVSHRLDQFYPVLINPPVSDIPEFLRKKRYVPGRPASAVVEVARMMEGTPGRMVRNKWVCSTSSEFTDMLAVLFDEDFIKLQIRSLFAPVKSEEVSDAEADSDSEDTTTADTD